MKAPSVIIFILLLFSIPIQGQEKPIQLNLKEGYRYMFEKVDYWVHLPKAGTRDTISLEKKVIQCDVEEVIPGEKIILKVSLKENFRKSPFLKGPTLNLDYFFPEYTSSNKFDNYFEELLCRVNLKYALDLKTRKAELLNKAELFDRFREIMIQKDNDALFAETTLQLIDQENKLENAELVSYLLWFQNARITPDGQISGSLLPGKPALWQASNEDYQFSKNELLNLTNEDSLVICRLDTVSGILRNFLKFSRLNDKLLTVEQLFSRNVMEKESRINWLSSGKIPPDLVFMTGKIEKPLSKKLYISYLQKPFGDEMQKKTVFLDENGSFSTDLTFAHSGFIYVENDNPNKYNPPATFVFYAEPGDSIHFEAKGQKMPWTVAFSGDRVIENQLLSELREKIRIKDKFMRISSPGGELLDGEIMYSFDVDVRNKRINTGDGVQQLITLLGKAKEIILKYKPHLRDHSFDFISNELPSYFYSAMYRYLWTVNTYFYQMYMTQKEEADLRQVLEYVEDFDIQSVYNDYGVQSRRMVSNYLTHNFNRNNKNRNYYRVNNGYRFSYHAEILMPYARMILSGSPLYREMAFILTGQYGYIPLNVDRNDSAIYRELINRNFDLMLKTCNDNEFLDEITRLKNLLLKSKAKNFVPEVSFFNTRGELVRFSHYFGSKPSVFQIAKNWVGDPYTFDTKTKENPDLNFIMVMEGNNFREWTEYQKAAEPVADQLLLKNDTTSLRDLFIRNYDFYIVYDKQGDLVGYENKLDRAITLAQKSLIRPQMPVNPAKLWFIIGILMGILVVFLMVGLGWRWKARRQLIKEQQQRHLRELELTAIRSQMNPHFLFNSLNSVQNLIQQNRSQEANQYLSDFAGLIRKVLKNSEKEEVPLAEELEMVRQYLNLEKLRFDFNVEISVDPDLDLQNTLIPSMLLQPIAENAVIHGLQFKSGKKELKIEIASSEEGLIISIEDNGIGREAARSFSTGKNGKGLKLIEERLKILKQKQGENYRFEIIDLNEDGLTGTRVEIVIPEEK